MYKSNIYLKLIPIVSFVVLGFSSAFAQFGLEMKLQLVDTNEWCVMVTPAAGAMPDSSTITGSGQATIVMPAGFSWSGLTSVSGLWTNNATVVSPVEDPTRQYVSFGLQVAEPTHPIYYTAGEETTLFCFQRDEPCPDTMYLIDCGSSSVTDPFCPDFVDATPGTNSVNSNPGNDLSVIQFSPGISFFNYSDNYAPSAWSCHDCDSDGILNAFEDTNGNGVFDPGLDSSDLCDPCDPIHVETATLNFVDGFDAICAGDVIDTAYMTVDIVGGWTPYTVILDNGSPVQDTFLNYRSGDTIAVVPTASTTYTLSTVIDSFLCEIDPDSMFGSIGIEVHGPISIVTEPVAVTECSEDGITFSTVANNAGVDGTIFYKWQESTDGGGTYIDLDDGAPYDGTDSTTVSIDPIAGLHGNYYRVKIWTDVCDTVFSTGVELQVEGPISVTSDPTDFIVCDNSAATFGGAAANANAPTGTLQYQWQANDGTNGWLDVPTGFEPAGVTYSNANTANLTINNTDVGMDEWEFRLAVFTDYCSRIFSNEAVLDVEGPLTVTVHPDDVSNCAGGEVFFTAEYTNPGGGVSNSYWEVSDDDGATWSAVTNPVPPVYNGISSTNIGSSGIDTLAITNVEGLDSNLYRMRIETGTCTSILTNEALLDVSGEITFTQEPTPLDIRVCAGNDTIIVACATIPQGEFYYYWEYSTDNGATWDSLQIGADANYDHSSNGAPMSNGCDTLTIHDATGLQYYWYRAVAAATDCIDVPSTEARLLVEGPLSVGTQPVNDTICSGEEVFFTADILNGGDTNAVVTYQWQWSTDNSNFFDISNGGIYGGADTEVLLISDVAGLHEYYFRLESTTSDCGFLYTNSAQLIVEGPITVTDQPEDVELCYNDAASFTAGADVGTFGTFSYQWQVSSDGLNWTDVDGVMSGGVYSGFNSTTLDISSVNGLYGLCYRLGFYTTECARFYSDPGCLTVQGPVSITDQPDDVTECSADDVTFAIDILNSSLDITNELYVQYKWQESSDGGTTWNDLTNGLSPQGGSGVNGVHSDTLTVMETAGRDNNQFRVLVFSEFCDTLISTAATLFIEGPLTFISEPLDSSECEGNGVSFTANATNAGLAAISYQWQISDDNGVTYTDISNGGIYTITGATTTTIDYDTVGYDLHGDRIRLKAWTPFCDTIYSEHAIFDVHGEIYFTNMPDDVTACSGDPVCFEVETDNDGGGTIQHRWQYSVNGTNWFDLANNSTYNGTGTSVMCIADISGLDSIEYRDRIWTTECAVVYSDPALLVEEGPITITDHPDDITQCSAESVEFISFAAIQAGNSGVLSYQWQASSDCVNFNDIADGGPAGYVGTDSTHLTVTNVAGLDSWCYRLLVTTGVCSAVESFSAQLNVEGPLSISLQPVGIQNCDDAEALFLSQITNPADPAGLQTEYQWQILMPSGTWEDLTNGDSWNGGTNVIGGANSDTLLITPLTGLNGAYVRMKGWTSTCDTLTTDSALIAVEGPLTFTDEPDDVTLCSSTPVQFTIAMNNSTGVGTVQYQWEYSQTGLPGTWIELVAATTIPGTTISGYNTNQLTINNTANMYNYKFRCKIRTGTCDWEVSQLAQLFVEGPITIDPEPVDTTICSNVGILIDTEVSVPAAASGALNFQWQVSSNSGASWSDLTDGQSTGTTNSYNGDVTASGEYFGTTSEDLTITLLEGLNGYMYRMLIWSSTCNDTTYEMTLTVQDACLTGTCDFDLDGTDNDNDLDDDNDQLADTWEDYLTNNNVTDSWFYLTEAAGAVSPQGNAGSPNLILYSNCDTDSDDDGFQDNLEDPDGDEINNGEETDGDGVFDGDPLDPCDPVLGPTCIGIQLAIDVYLQGGKIGNQTSYPYPMRDDLRQIDNASDQFIVPFPTSEPYTDLVDELNGQSMPDTLFFHKGDGGDEDLGGASLLSITGQDAIIDWVFVELRASTNLDSVITTRAALLQADGDVVDIDGVSDLTFVNAPAGPYYVVVRHRNHLGIMTAEALDLSPIVSVVDFTDPATPTYGDHGQIEINSLNYLWGGDFNSNDRVVYQGPFNDINYLFADIVNDQADRFLDGASPTYDPDYAIIANWISNGYHRSDINIDSRVIYQGPLNDRQLMLFNTTLSHPLNDGHIANFVIEGSLP